jgi:lipoate-protein ligase A
MEFQCSEWWWGGFPLDTARQFGSQGARLPPSELPSIKPTSASRITATMAPSRGLYSPGVFGYISKCVSAPTAAPFARRSFATASVLPICSANIAQSVGPPTLRSSHSCNFTRTKVFAARRGFSSFTERLADPANKLQSYISRSSDPYLNLSIEDHILRKSPADSTVLFLYVNRPCVVIGRNQNPWTEVNLGILDATPRSGQLKDMESPGIGRVDIVRRRSGGGTVFHDRGNLNWSITCPRSDFTRDKYAEMVVRALRKQGIERARVNERHDIVLDQGHEKREHDPEDTHRTPYTVDGDLPKPLKVSGSAYKLTRLRALHHATTLLESPNLQNISKYLRSPAKNNIEAKGVESVSSPVTNIGLDVEAFQKRLQEEFAATFAGSGGPSIVESVGDEYLSIPDIKKGYDELRVCSFFPHSSTR